MAIEKLVGYVATNPFECSLWVGLGIAAVAGLKAYYNEIKEDISRLNQKYSIKKQDGN